MWLPSGLNTEISNFKLRIQEPWENSYFWGLIIRPLIHKWKERTMYFGGPSVEHAKNAATEMAAF